jgi:hypothetical protein
VRSALARHPSDQVVASRAHVGAAAKGYLPAYRRRLHFSMSRPNALTAGSTGPISGLTPIRYTWGSSGIHHERRAMVASLLGCLIRVRGRPHVRRRQRMVADGVNGCAAGAYPTALRVRTRLRGRCVPSARQVRTNAASVGHGRNFRCAPIDLGSASRAAPTRFLSLAAEPARRRRAR